jgi:hypothetical protein
MSDARPTRISEPQPARQSAHAAAECPDNGGEFAPDVVMDVRLRPAVAFKPLLPFMYTSKVKRPTEKYFLHGILGYDYLIGLLAFALPSDRPLRTALCLALYILAFFSVYEIGYFENDKIAVTYEEHPVVSSAFAQLGSQFSPLLAWVTGLALAGLGATLQATLRLEGPFVPAALPWTSAWLTNWALMASLIVATRLMFWWFNHLPPKLRLLPMLPMQMARVLGYALVFATSIVGALLCASHALARWVTYGVYRAGGDRRRFPTHLTTLFLFVSFAGVVVLFDRIGIAGGRFPPVPHERGLDLGHRLAMAARRGHDSAAVQGVIVTAYLLARALRDLTRGSFTAAAKRRTIAAESTSAVGAKR